MSRGRARPQLLRVEQIRSKLVFGMPAPWRILPVHGVDVEGQQRVERPRGAPSLKPTGNVLCSTRSVMAGHLSRPKEVVLFLFGSRGSRSPCATTARKAAAVKLMRKLLKKPGFVPDLMATDKLRSYGAAKAEIGLCGLATSRACTSTIGLRIHISRRDCPSERLELDWRCI
jgi:hypothetical protein